jgi:hypothetical protein
MSQVPIAQMLLVLRVKPHVRNRWTNLKTTLSNTAEARFEEFFETMSRYINPINQPWNEIHTPLSTQLQNRWEVNRGMRLPRHRSPRFVNKTKRGAWARTHHPGDWTRR